MPQVHPAIASSRRRHNKDRPYREQVRPFGFLLAFQADPTAMLDLELPRTVAPYDPDPATAVRGCFDRENGNPVAPEQLKSYRRILAQYHLHPEAKFHHADYLDAGPTSRRHVVVTAIEHIGKEANRWEEQLHLGEDPEAQIVYGLAPEDRDRGRIARSQRQTTTLQAARELSNTIGLREFARKASTDPGHLSRVLGGERPLTPRMLARIEEALGDSTLDSGRSGKNA